jgi:acyl-CoA-binding protein
MAKHNWIKIRTKYVTSREPISYAKLAELYELNETTIAERASKEGWVALRQQTQEITQQKTIELTTSTISSYNAHKFLQGQQVADKAVTVLLDPNIKIGGKVANEMRLAGRGHECSGGNHEACGKCKMESWHGTKRKIQDICSELSNSRRLRSNGLPRGN